MYDEMEDTVGVRETVGGSVFPRGHVGGDAASRSLAQRLDALQAGVDHLDQTVASGEAAGTRVREAQAAEARARDRRYREMIFGRQANGPEVGRALGESLVGGPVPVRESVHPLGKVISGAHSHGSVRHTHDRLPGDHLHCMHCGGDSRLCLDNPHHAEGPVPVRESNGQAQPNVFVEAMDAIYDGETSPVTPGQALAHVWRLEHGPGRSGQSAQADGRGLADAWEKRCGGPRP